MRHEDLYIKDFGISDSEMFECYTFSAKSNGQISSLDSD